ncbi:MAG: hypothetical protein UE295_10465 [Acutalibacteraceae bacterium]|nr:hypothetical protein [Acutalibacteraceae bacterium]
MKNKLRFIAVLIVSIICLSSFSVSASAQGVYANIENISTYLEIPSHFNVTSANAYADQSLTYEVKAVTADNANSLIITSEKTNEAEDVFNFKYLSKEMLDKELSDINSGNNTLCGNVYENVSNASYKEQDNAIIFNLYNRNATSNAIAYSIINGQLVTVQYISNDGELTVAEKGVFNKILDSLTVNQLYQKPQYFKLSDVFAKLFSITIFFVILLLALLFAYYASGFNSKKKSSRQLADKYYNELKNEGLMDEAQQASDKTDDEYSNVIEPSEKVRPKDYSASVMDTMRKPRIIEDEWEDVDLDKMFALPDQDVDQDMPQDDFESITENPSEYFSKDMFEDVDEQKQPSNIHSAERESAKQSSSRADSARRYAKLYMGQNVDHKHEEAFDYSSTDEMSDSEGTTSLTPEQIARIEERHKQRVLKRIRERKGKKRKRRTTTSTTQRSATTRPSKRTRKPTNGDNLFAEFELDGYWDKYKS